MFDKKIRMMVGPTEIPQRVLQAMNRQVISHRSKEYSEMHGRVVEGMKKLFRTDGEIIILTTSGTGTMESVIQNCFSANDKVVVPVVGNFSKRYGDIAEAYGLEVVRVEFEPGETADVEKVMAVVDADTKGVLLVHNESSTGIFNDLEAFGKALKDTDTLLITDSVSGTGGLDVEMDNWGVDVVLTGSQKALMAPPGLGFVALSDKAWKHIEEATLPKYFFDYKRMRDFNKKNQTPWTVAIHTMFAVDEALNMVFEEGLEEIYIRHNNNAKMIRDGVKKLGLELFAKDENFASPTLTTVYAPGKAKAIVKALGENGVIVGGGLAPFDEDTLRIGTMGYISENDVAATLYALEKSLKQL